MFYDITLPRPSGLQDQGGGLVTGKSDAMHCSKQERPVTLQLQRGRSVATYRLPLLSIASTFEHVAENFAELWQAPAPGSCLRAQRVYQTSRNEMRVCATLHGVQRYRRLNNEDANPDSCYIVASMPSFSPACRACKACPQLQVCMVAPGASQPLACH